MVSQITLGNVGSQNGKTVITGSQSGLDIEGLVKGLTEAKRLPAVALETKNTKLGKQKSALTELQSLLTRFRSAVDTLRNPPGVQNASKNIFEYRSATTSLSGYVDVKVQPGAAQQSFAIDEISAIAKETKQQTATTFLAASPTTAIVAANGDATAGKFSAGTFNLRVLDGGADASITLAETDSLQSIVTKFNAVKDRTGIQANLVKVASGTPDSTYTITFTATKTGTTAAFDLGSAGTVTSDPDGVLAQLGFNTTQTAQNAQFKIDGVDIVRETNTVDDLVDGVTFTLKQPAAVPVNVSVQPDTELVTNALNAFADVYNELRVFAAKQNQVGDDGLPTEDAVLFGNATLRAIADSMTNVATSLVSGLQSTSPQGLSDLGIGFDDFAGDDENPLTRNIITINADKLASALATNFDAVRDVLEFRFTSDNPNLLVFKRTNDLKATSATLNLDFTNNVFKANVNGIDYDLDVTANNATSFVIKGKAGTPLEGMEFVYGANTDTTINISMTQGLGDRMYNELDRALSADGSVINALDGLQAQEDRNKKEITKIDDFIEGYRERLLEQYSALEAALAKANNLLSLLDAQANARNNQ